MLGKSRGLLSSGFWNILSIIITAIGAFVSMPVIINGIGTDNYGLFSIILMMGGFAALQDFGLGEATLRFISFYSAKNNLDGINRVMQSTLMVYLVTLIVVFSLLQVLAVPIIGLFKLDPSQINIGVKSFKIACISFFLATLGQALQKIPEAILRYDISNIVNIIFTILRFISMIIIVNLGYGLEGLVWILVLISLFRLIGFYFVSTNIIPGITIYPGFNIAGIKEVFSFSLYSFFNQIISQISQNADRIVLGIFFNVSAVGFLSAPKDIIQRVSGITGGAGQALFPRFSSMDIDQEMSQLYKHSLWVLSFLSLVLLIPLAIIIPGFLQVWISLDFSTNSAEFARLFSLGMAFNGGVVVYFSLLKGINKINWLTNIMSSLTMLSIIVTVILVYKYGIVGSGVRTILFSWIGTVICVVVGKKIFGNLYNYKSIIEFSILLPISGLLVYISGILFLNYYSIETWFSVITNYILYASMTFIVALALNYLIFQRNGSCYYFWKLFKIKFVK